MSDFLHDLFAYIRTKSVDSAIAHLHLRTLALAPFSNKQQRNLRRYDDTPAKNGRVCMNVIP